MTKKWLCSLRIFAAWIASFSIFTCAYAQEGAESEGLKYYDEPKTWEQRFTFKGQSRPGPYEKDPNVWVYTEKFANRFGMPKQWVDPNLKGIEAAAWRRVHTGVTTCGWAGKEDACKEEYRCYLDVYIDEREHPLPWATDRMVDWHEDYTSLRWLASQSGERHRSLSSFFGQNMRYGGVTRPPFIDVKTKQEVFYFATANPQSKGVPHRMFGYERSAYPGLTLLVMLPLQCEFGASEPPTDNYYWLDSRSEFSVVGKVLNRFHKFMLPMEFDRRVKEVLRDQKRQEIEFNKKNLDFK